MAISAVAPGSIPAVQTAAIPQSKPAGVVLFGVGGTMLGVGLWKGMGTPDGRSVAGPLGLMTLGALTMAAGFMLGRDS